MYHTVTKSEKLTCWSCTYSDVVQL